MNSMSTRIGILLVIALAHAAPAAELPQDGLLAYWSFDNREGNRVLEDSGRGLDLALAGTPQETEGVRGKSLRLDGSRDYAAIQDAGVFDFSTATFSVAAWVNVYALRGQQQMIVAKNVYSANQREWGLMIDRDRRFRFYLQHERKWKTVESTTVPVPGRWYHVAVTAEAGAVCLYVNGKCEGQAELGQPIPNTEAPLTIGAVNDGGRVWQTLFGAVDEVCLYRRALTAEEVAGMHFPVTATHALPEDPRVTLWDPDQPVPASTDCPLLEGVEFVVVKARVPEQDGYNWLHGAAVCWHRDSLYASFGHNQGDENTATEVANGRSSVDGGRTWGPLFGIDDGDTSNPAVSHGVLLSHTGQLWAFQGAFQDRMQGVHTLAYVLDESNQRWQPQGVVAEHGFWPCQQPLKMDDGNWIMAGIAVTDGYGGPNDPAAVAISHGDDLLNWDVIAIPKPGELEMWGESAVIVEGNDVLLISRWRSPVALAASSRDFGRTWTEIRESNLPMAASKPYCGTLSTGQRYLVCTTTSDCGNRRSPLTIAVSRPDENFFSRIYRIRDAVHDGPGESDPNCRLSYPYAVEHAGRLYVIYSNDGSRGANRNSAELAIIPLAALAVED